MQEARSAKFKDYCKGMGVKYLNFIDKVKSCKYLKYVSIK